MTETTASDGATEVEETFTPNEQGVAYSSESAPSADAPLRPEGYRELVLATVNTHDLPPTAGYLAEEHVDEYLAVPEPLSRGGDEFLLRIRGDSMINAGILDGDLVVIRKQDTANTGDIIVALIDEEEATLKRFRRRAGRRG